MAVVVTGGGDLSMHASIGGDDYVSSGMPLV